MRCQPIGQALLLSLLWVGVTQAADGGPDPEAERRRLQQQIQDATKLTGAAYLSKRDKLVAAAKGNPAAFAEIERTTKNWQIRLLCRVVAERVRMTKKIQAFLDWEPRIPHQPVLERRIAAIGAAIAEKGQDVPLFLTETFWRDIEPPQWRGDERQRAYLAHALGLLKVKAAREPLEGALAPECHTDIRREASKALGRIGDPKSVGPLLRMLEQNPDGTDVGTWSATDAIVECVAEQSLPLLEQRLRTSKNKRVKYACVAGMLRLKGEAYVLGLGVGTRYGYLDPSGKMVAEPRFRGAWSFSEGLASVKPVDKWGFIDAKGKITIKPQFDKVSDFREGLAAARIGVKWGFIGKSGKFVIQPRFTDSRSFSNGLAAVKLGDKWGYIDKTGKVIVPFRFDKAKEFSRGLAPVRVGDKWGYTDRAGRMVVKPQFSYAESFGSGPALVTLD